MTDNCNLRCFYCMPEEDYAFTPASRLMQAIEIEALAKIFISNGVNKGATNVAMAVTITLSTKFAFAKYTITLLANPLLQLPIKIMPAAISGSK